MSTIKDLKLSISELSSETAVSMIVQSRQRRRTPIARTKKKKAPAKKKKVSTKGLSKKELLDLIAAIQEMETNDGSETT